MKRFSYVLIGLLFVFVTTGCDVTYTLEILGNNYNEIIDIPISDKSIENYPVEAYYDVSGDMEDPSNYVDGVQYYDDTVDFEKEIVNFSYSFSKTSFARSNFAKTCYENFTILTDDETNNIIISSGREFLCFDEFELLNSVVVKIKTNHEVISSNADSVEDDIYIWNINKVNYDDVAINMVLSSSVKEHKLSFWEKNLLWIFCLIFIVIGGITYLFMKRRSEKVDKI